MTRRESVDPTYGSMLTAAPAVSGESRAAARARRSRRFNAIAARTRW
jgi:hypothetical protein